MFRATARQVARYAPVEYVGQDYESGFRCTLQNGTFIASLAVQFVLLIVSFVTIIVGDATRPQLLTVSLWLETLVQLVEFFWYSVVGALLFFANTVVGPPGSFGVQYRYFDWFLTTPTMLITLYLLVYYFHETCTSTAALRDVAELPVHLVMIILFDWGMLALGLTFELGLWPRGLWSWPLVLGFVPLFLAFYPHVSLLGERATDEAVALIVVNLTLWSIYGMVSIAFPQRQGLDRKNIAFNVLDLLSKNVLGVVVSILSLTRDNHCVPA